MTTERPTIASGPNRAVDYLVIGLGALGSATAYQLARRGHQVVGLEQFRLGHERGASHDTSRILRHSYHTPAYVRLTFDAYADWAALESDSGESLVTTTGGIDIYPGRITEPAGDTLQAEAAAAADRTLESYTSSMRALGVPFHELTANEASARWPMFRFPHDAAVVYQERSAVVPAARGTATMQRMARHYGAELREDVKVTRIQDSGDGSVVVTTARDEYVCSRVVVCADAWTNDVLTGLGVSLPLTVTLEQVTYFRTADSDRFDPARMPLWIWMGDPCYYGFPCYGEPTVKAAQDCGGEQVTADHRTFQPDAGRLDDLTTFVTALLPGAGPPVRSKTCLYTVTPDRDFVIDRIPGHENVMVGLGAAHGFKFAPTIGRILADLATDVATTADISPFRMDRPALTDPATVPASRI